MTSVGQTGWMATRRAAMVGLMASTAVPALAQASASTAGTLITPDIVVAQDGSGDFTTIHAAVQSIPRNNRERRIILVKNGIYEERVRVDAAYVTLRGQSRLGVRLQFDWPADNPRDDLSPGVLNIASTAHDFVLESMTVHNTVKTAGPHAFAIMGRADRTIIQDADVLSLGADTLALWRTGKTREENGLSEGLGATPLSPDGGRYYHRNLRVIGSVDFICPRGWCYLADSEVAQVFERADAIFWHEGKGDADKKFVIRNCVVDGPPAFYLARHHRDAQFYFLDCVYSERLRDQPPYYVVYPIGGGEPTAEDLERNARGRAETLWGERSYFAGSRRANGLYSWMMDNLGEAPGAPRKAEMTAAWTFGVSWDPEREDGPRVTAVIDDGDSMALTFDRLVTVRGAPVLIDERQTRADYMSGSGTQTLRFGMSERRGRRWRLDQSAGAIISSEAVSKITLAEPGLPDR